MRHCRSDAVLRTAPSASLHDQSLQDADDYVGTKGTKRQLNSDVWRKSIKTSTAQWLVFIEFGSTNTLEYM